MAQTVPVGRAETRGVTDMRKLTLAAALTFALGAISQGAMAMGCEHESHAKKNDFEPPAPATAAVVEKTTTQKKKQDSES